MMPQKNQFRFPRLQAALALAGIFAFTPASAEAPSCETDWEGFGAYEMKSLMRDTDYGLRLDVSIVRRMPTDSDAYILRSSYLDQREAMQAAYFEFGVYYFLDDSSEETEMKNERVRFRFPSINHEEINSELEDIAILIGDRTITPGFSWPISDSEQYNWPVLAGRVSSVYILEQWEAGEVVTIQFSTSRGDEKVVVGSVEAGPDAIAEYAKLRQHQANRLVSKSERGECTLSRRSSIVF